MIALSGLDQINAELLRYSISYQIMNVAPIDLYIMHDPIKGRLLNTEGILSHLPLSQYILPRILYISDGTLYREGFIQVLQRITDFKDREWFKNLEEFHVVKNYIASYDIFQTLTNPNYAQETQDQIVSYLNGMCTDKTYFPKLRTIDLRMNGYNLQGSANFANALSNACDASSGVSVLTDKTLVKYPVFCVNDEDFNEQSTTRTYYYDMNDPKDAAQCRHNWNWEVNGMFNNDIIGPYPLGNTPNCPGYMDITN